MLIFVSIMNFPTLGFLVGLISFHGLANAALKTSPLTSRHPEIEIAQHMRRQHEWRSAHEIQEYSDILSNAYQSLITDAKLQSAGLHNISQCTASLVSLGVDAVFKEQYALQALDASGKPQSGIMLGNVRWNGRYFECQNVHNKLFTGKWCEATLGVEYDIIGQTQTIGLSVGLCMPECCSEEYIAHHLQPLANETKQNIFVQCPVQSTTWTAIDVVSFFIFCVLLFLVAFGTMVGMYLDCKKTKESQNLSINGDGIYGISSDIKYENQSVWVKVALSFSIIENTRILFDTKSRPGTIDCLHGMRFLSISWVVLGHTYVMTLIYINNSVDMIRWVFQAFSFQTISNATFSVDTFFFLSGLLVCYLSLKDVKRRNGKLNVPLMYLQRYLRLTPTYAFLILFLVGFYSKIGDGPMWPNALNGTSGVCREYWWTNLLYINNFHPSALNGECFTLGWYLANDMQFFLLAPISIILLNWRPKIGLNLLVFGIFSSLLVTGVISAHYKEQPQSLGLALLLKQLDPDPPSPNSTLHKTDNVGIPPMNAHDTFWSDLYAKPWCRIGVYLIGMVTGYILHVTKCRIKMSKLFVGFGWAIATAINLAVLYGLWGYVKDATMMSVSLAAFYNTMSRPMWAVGLAWVVIACSAGYGGPVNTFLSWKLFVPLSRLTYCIYLVHTLILFWWFSTQEQSTYFSNTQFSFYFIAILFSSIFVAYFLSMLIESPVVRLVRVFTSHRKHEETPAPETGHDPLLVNEEQPSE